MEAELDKFRRNKKKEQEKLAKIEQKGKVQEWWSWISNILTRAVFTTS